jgi:hypothetical protein
VCTLGTCQLPAARAALCGTVARCNLATVGCTRLAALLFGGRAGVPCGCLVAAGLALKHRVATHALLLCHSRALAACCEAAEDAADGCTQTRSCHNRTSTTRVQFHLPALPGDGGFTGRHFAGPLVPVLAIQDLASEQGWREEPVAQSGADALVDVVAVQTPACQP